MKLNVVKQRGIWWLLSGLLIVISIAAMALSWSQFNGPVRPGLDFIGGTRLQIERDCSEAAACESPIEITDIREILDDQG
ncbi:MAG: protein translocase subunit SecF, partial [Cyanobacteria bacterium J06607_17]